MSLLALLGAAGSNAAKNYIEDLFTVTLWDGNGYAQKITTGIDALGTTELTGAGWSRLHDSTGAWSAMQPTYVQVDSVGNLYVAYQIEEQSPNYNAGYLAKYSSAGILQWSRKVYMSSYTLQNTINNLQLVSDSVLNVVANDAAANKLVSYLVDTATGNVTSNISLDNTYRTGIWRCADGSYWTIHFTTHDLVGDPYTTYRYYASYFNSSGVRQHTTQITESQSGNDSNSSISSDQVFLNGSNLYFAYNVSDYNVAYPYPYNCAVCKITSAGVFSKYETNDYNITGITPCASRVVVSYSKEGNVDCAIASLDYNLAVQASKIITLNGTAYSLVRPIGELANGDVVIARNDLTEFYSFNPSTLTHTGMMYKQTGHGILGYSPSMTVKGDNIVLYARCSQTRGSGYTFKVGYVGVTNKSSIQAGNIALGDVVVESTTVTIGLTNTTLATSNVIASADGSGISLPTVSTSSNPLNDNGTTDTRFGTKRNPKTFVTPKMLVWTKSRNAAYSHYLRDTVSTPTPSQIRHLSTNSTAAFTSNSYGIQSYFGADGFYLSTGSSTTAEYNNQGKQVGFVFKAAPKFMDIVTFTGTNANQTVSHALGTSVGMLIVHRVSGSGGDWSTFVRMSGGNYAYFNGNGKGLNGTGTADASGVNAEGLGYITATAFNPHALSGSAVVGANNNINDSGATYIAYLFAHDASVDGVIQCGSFTANGGGSDLNIELGFEPQLLLMKNTSVAGDWLLLDTARGFTEGNSLNLLKPNATSTEQSETSTRYFGVTATGFKTLSGSGGFGFAAGNSICYMAIRRPMKKPTSGTQVFQAVARTGTGSTTDITGVGFPPDMVIGKSRTTAGWDSICCSRLRGTSGNFVLYLNSTTQELTNQWGAFSGFGQDGVSVAAGINGSQNINTSSQTYINYFFRRYPGVFDEVCYTGTGVARTVAHNLGVVPELVIVKGRSYDADWFTYVAPIGDGANSGLRLNTIDAKSAGYSPFWTVQGGALPTASVLNISTGAAVNNNGSTFVAYLFATLPGISKVGTYTGDGTSGRVIDCGFTTGARFVMIKRVDSTSDWYVFDTVRGIVAGADSMLRFNTTTAEDSTQDILDPAASGFAIESTSAFNTTGWKFIYLALA